MVAPARDELAGNSAGAGNPDVHGHRCLPFGKPSGGLAPRTAQTQPLSRQRLAVRKTCDFRTVKISPSGVPHGPGPIPLASALRSLRFAVIVIAKTMIAATIRISKIFALRNRGPF